LRSFVSEIKRSERGLSLIELLIALAVTSILLVGIFNIFLSQHRTYMAQDQIVEMQENVRAALDIMLRDIRMAGYDPTEAGGMGITNIDEAIPSLSFTADINENGVIGASESNEDITYRYDANNLVIRRKSTTNDNLLPLVSNIQSLNFRYFDENGNLLPSPVSAANVRIVEISITSRASNPDPYYSQNSGFRTRTLTSKVNLRNLGFSP